MILDEVKRTQMTKLKRPFPEDLAEYWRQEVTAAFPETMIDGFEPLLPRLANHEKDRHVLAAAIMGGVPMIVTFNVKDFPTAALEPWNVRAVHPQDYLLMLYSMDPKTVLAKLADMASDQGGAMQDILVHLSKSVPAFSRQLLQDLGKVP